jgi:cobalt transporter subunit CbtB
VTSTYLPALPRPVVTIRTAGLWLLGLSAALFLVAFEQGTLTAGSPVLHEAFHDARHLLGFPCH